MSESFTNKPTTAVQKLDSWSQTRERVTDGLLHDFNNLVTGIHALGEALRVQSEGLPALQDSLESIQSNALKARQVVNQIISLHRGQLGSKSYHDLNKLVAEHLELIRKSLTHSIKTEIALASEPLPVLIDGIAFGRALMTACFDLAGKMMKGDKLRFETKRKTYISSRNNPQSAAGICLEIKLTPNKQAISPSATATVNLLDELHFKELQTVAENSKGEISTGTDPTCLIVLCLLLPEADFSGDRTHQ